MIGFIDTSSTISLNYNHSRQLTVSDCLKLVQFLLGPRVSSTVTDLGLIQESATSSASVVLWITLHSWTLLTNADFCTTDLHEWLLLMTPVRLTELPNELPLISLCGPATEHPFERFFCCIVRIRCHGNACSPKSLPSNGLFRVVVQIPRQRPVVTDTGLAKRPLAVDHSGFRRHVTIYTYEYTYIKTH
jgi:hypothetical protein